MELTLLRHGPTVGNMERRYIGVTDQPLSQEGRKLALRIRTPEVQRVYSSPLLRCIETAALCYPGLPVKVIPALRETDFGLFEGKCFEELKDVPEYQRWLDSGGKTAFPGGESPEDAARRALGGLEAVLADAAGIESAAVVTHGGTIMAIMSALCTPSRSYYDWQLPNCGFYVVDAQGGRLTLLSEAAANG